MANSASGESVIHRVIRLLSCFSVEQPSFSTRELARASKLPLSTVHRISAELEVEGLLEKDPEGRWRQGARLWEVASRGSDIVSLREAALPPMEDVLSVTGNHVSLGIMEGNDVLYIERLAVDDSTVNITAPAERLPAHASSAGLVLHAYGSKAQQDLLLSRRLEKIVPGTMTDPDELRSVLARIRQDGFFSYRAAIVPESTGISVPILRGDGTVIAAMTIIVPIGQERLGVTVPQLKLATSAVARRLGFSPVKARGARYRRLSNTVNDDS